MRDACLAIVILATGCTTPPKATPAPPSAPTNRPQGTVRMVERMAELANRSDRVRDPMLSSRRIPIMRKEALPTDPPARIEAERSLAVELLRAGDTDEAITILERLLGEVSGFAGEGVKEVQLAILDWLSVAHVSAALRNECLTADVVDPCLIPRTAGGGPQRRHDHARVAASGFDLLLKSTPDNLAARWLLNLAHMTLGQYPDSVPPAWLIPPEAFGSQTSFPRFPEIARGLGLAVVGHAGGSAMEDFNGDGYLDLIVSSMGVKDQVRLFFSNRDGTFTERTVEAGLEGITGALNLNQTDFDNDGDRDVLLIRGGWDRLGGQPMSLLENRGDGTFADVTEAAGLLKMRANQTVGWGDYNNDGWLDLYIGNESLDRTQPNELFENQHDGTFKDVTKQTGTGVAGYTKGVTWGDIDNDGRLDLYVSRMDLPNVLLHNEGPDSSGIWRFKDITATAGVAEPEESFSTWVWDYDNDGWLDLFVNGYRFNRPRNCAADVTAEYLGRPHGAELPRLYRNRGNRTFEDVTKKVGLDKVMCAMGANFGDLDNDGWLDFYVATGDPDFRSVIPNRMFRSVGARAFEEVTTAGGFGILTKGHGVSFGDLDNDGDQDIFANMGGMLEADVAPSVLLENPGFGNHWITLVLEGVKSNRAAIGARIAVAVDGAEGPRTIHRVVSSGGSFGGNSLQQEIGIGGATAIREISIRWPGGGTQAFRGVPIDQAYLVREGDSLPRPRPNPAVHLAKTPRSSTPPRSE